MPHSLSPSPKPGALADELAIAAMVRALRGLSDFDLCDQRLRAVIYLDAGIPLHHMYAHDAAAVKVECALRRARAKAPPAVLPVLEFTDAAE